MHIFRHIFLSNYWWQRSDIWSQASYRYPISWEAFLDPSDSYFLLPTLLIFIHIEHPFCICPFLVAFFSATIDGRNMIFGHKLHIGTPYRGKCFLTRQIPTSCLPKSGGIISSQFILFDLFLRDIIPPLDESQGYIGINRFLHESLLKIWDFFHECGKFRLFTSGA